jgi:hypothetical protein
MQRDLTAPYVDDGLIEVVGFRDAWHGLILLAPKGHGTRLAQVKYLGCFIPWFIVQSITADWLICGISLSGP